MKEYLLEEIKNAVDRVRNEGSFSPSITNTVTINFVANAQLAVGGAAAMVYLADEAVGVASQAGTLYINLGTMFSFYEETFKALSKLFKVEKISWVLDPVGIGLGNLRTRSLDLFKETPPAIIRANASEVILLAKMWGLDSKEANLLGVEANDSVDMAREAAIKLARFTKGAVAVSGQVDLITDGKVVARVSGGSSLMEKITGAGCSLGGVCQVYLGKASPFVAALAASFSYKYAGFEAERLAKGPGSFQVEFLNMLGDFTRDKVEKVDFTLEEVL